MTWNVACWSILTKIVSFQPVLAQFFLALWWPKNLVKMGFGGILRTMQGTNVPKCDMLVYPDHLQKWIDFGQYSSNFRPYGSQKT